MTKLRDDAGLRERFRELRGETAETGRVPDFQAVWERARAQAAERPSLGVVTGGGPSAGPGAPSYRRFLRAGAWASAALAATVAGLLLVDRRAGDDDEFARLVAAYSSDVSSGFWETPTSRLLDVPGIELVRSLPLIGAPVRGLDPMAQPGAAQTREESL